MAPLVLSLVCLAVWLAGVLLVPISLPLFHLLLAAGATLAVIGWARRH